MALFCAGDQSVSTARDRIHVSDSSYEYPRGADRTRPVDFEVYQITEVLGHGVGAGSEQEVPPVLRSLQLRREHQHSAYFTTRREPRLITAEQKRRGVRSSYIGSEVFLGLVDAAHAPFSGDLRQFSIQTLCTNRDLVLLMPVGIGKAISRSTSPRR